MTVGSILSVKGEDVVTATPDQTAAGLCALLTKHRIGAVVILDSARKIVGIISERDIVRAIGQQGSEILNRPVADFMTKDVVTASRNDTIDTVMGRMSQARFRHMPIAEDGELAGIVSIGDVVKAKIAAAQEESEAMRSYISAV